MATIWRSPPDSDPARWLPALPEQREQLAHVVEALVEATRLLVEPHLEVLLHGETREHVVGLRDVAEPHGHQRVRLPARDVFAPQAHRPAAHRDQPEQRLQQRRLAGTVRADDADELAAVEREAAAVEDVHLRHVAGDDVVRLEQRTGPVVGLDQLDLLRRVSSSSAASSAAMSASVSSNCRRNSASVVGAS